MIGLVNVKKVPGSRFKPCVKELTPVEIAGIGAMELRAEIPARASQKRVQRCLRECGGLLRSIGARQICFNEGSILRNHFTSMGFSELSSSELLKAMAGDILAGASKSRDRAFICAGRLDRWVKRAFASLCQNFRYVTMEVPESIAAALFDIAGYHGVSPTYLGKDRVVDHDAAVFFSPPAAPCFLSGSCGYVVIDGTGGIYGGRPLESVVFSFPSKYKGAIPDGYPAETLMSWLLTLGRISPDEIKVDSARWASSSI